MSVPLTADPSRDFVRIHSGGLDGPCDECDALDALERQYCEAYAAERLAVAAQAARLVFPSEARLDSTPAGTASGLAGLGQLESRALHPRRRERRQLRRGHRERLLRRLSRLAGDVDPRHRIAITAAGLSSERARSRQLQDLSRRRLASVAPDLGPVRGLSLRVGDGTGGWW